MPQLLEHFGSAEQCKTSVQEALRQGMQWEAEEEGYDPEEDGLLWSVFYGEYHRRLVIGRIHIIDERALASEGRDAGKVLVVFHDGFGRVVREARVNVWYAADITFLDNCYLDEYGCWVNGWIREEYDWEVCWVRRMVRMSRLWTMTVVMSESGYFVKYMDALIL